MEDELFKVQARCPHIYTYSAWSCFLGLGVHSSVGEDGPQPFLALAVIKDVWDSVSIGVDPFTPSTFELRTSVLGSVGRCYGLWLRPCPCPRVSAVVAVAGGDDRVLLA